MDSRKWSREGSTKKSRYYSCGWFEKLLLSCMRGGLKPLSPTIYWRCSKVANAADCRSALLQFNSGLRLGIIMEKNLVEENGHKWWNAKELDDRCVRCSIKYGYYLDIKRALEVHPERADLKELIKCKIGVVR